MTLLAGAFVALVFFCPKDSGPGQGARKAADGGLARVLKTPGCIRRGCYRLVAPWPEPLSSSEYSIANTLGGALAKTLGHGAFL